MAWMSDASGHGVIGHGDVVDLSGADTVFGFNGTDLLSAGAGRASANDAFLDDRFGGFDAALGYTLAYQNLLAQAWKGEPSLILQHLDRDGSCAPLTEAEAAMIAARASSDAPALAATDLAIDHVVDLDAADGPVGSDGDADFSDAGMAGADLFGMS